MSQQKWLLDGPKTIEVDGIRKLKVGLVAGHIDVIAHDEPVTRIEVHSVSGKDLRITADGETLDIDHAQLSWENWLDVFRNFRPGAARADVSILVPRDVALKLGVVSATALVSGLHADADLSTVSGDLATDGISGDLQLNSVSGELSARNHYGKIVAHTVSGDITATGAVLAFSSDGVSGNVFLDLADTPDLVKINSVSGTVTARLEADVPTSYAINTVSGRLQLDDAALRVRGKFTGKVGVLEGRWTDFRANTVSGDISVMHVARADAAAPAETPTS
ncbi:DUF4097 family beta strand repeat-containing protein [Pseudolysinimonas yzui]|uniref:DUF4097 domain-containing protein n=1 Tax=Pseudolysinimonas yzui TaxID=2708254 RepID=A0A8J3M2S1_9MICO|nr:DUF4097 family beta strand repeat-containing protein [Pseudolysinimonas yzui]GHF22378.1 hypothetical protein GCM10011600_24450 [Pseudolysinimonas yzui]